MARFVARHIADTLVKTDEFQSGNLKDALARTFLRMDEIMVTPEAQEELRVLENSGASSSGRTRLQSLTWTKIRSQIVKFFNFVSLIRVSIYVHAHIYI